MSSRREKNIPHELQYRTVHMVSSTWNSMGLWVCERARGWGGPSIVVWPSGGSHKETIKELKNSTEADDFLM